jgi:hypothetical protein
MFVFPVIKLYPAVCFNSMPELNSSKHRRLLGFFTGDFKFYCILLGKRGPGVT